MIILITGINGFVGRILEDNLKSLGHTVYGIDLNGEREFVLSGDLRNSIFVNEALASIDPDFIYHLAAISNVDFSKTSVLYDVNINSTLNILNAIATKRRKAKFIYISSSQVYGLCDSGNNNISENMPVIPANHYGATKAAGENITFAYHYEYGIPVTILRPFNHTGKNQQRTFVIPKIIDSFSKKLDTINLGNIDVQRDFLDVRDIVEAYILLLNDFPNGEIFNLASGKGITIRYIIELLEKITNHKIEVKIDRDLIRDNEIWYSVGNCDKFRTRYQFSPQFSIVDTLKWMIS